MTNNNKYGKTPFELGLEDAYSFPQMGWSIMTDIADLMYEKGYSEDQVEGILRSKHARWFMDRFSEDIGNAVRASFALYLGVDINNVSEDLADMEINPDVWVKEKQP